MTAQINKWILLSCALFLTVVTPVSAQQLGLAEYIQIKTPNLSTGTIIVHHNGQYSLSNEPYSKDLLGVITLKPAIEFSPSSTNEFSYPLVKNGVVEVQINGQGGPIQVGDLITSSSTPGVGMKAAQSGFVLGVAQKEFIPNSADEISTIPVFLDMRFAFSDDAPESKRIVSRLMSIVSLNTVSFVEEPVKSLRYTSAAIAILFSLFISLFTFGRIAYKGIEAIGRNPLAKNTIILGIVINTGLALTLIVAGISVAYIIVTW